MEPAKFDAVAARGRVAESPGMTMNVWSEDLVRFELPYASTAALRRNVFAGAARPRVAVVAALHGDELDGMYLCQQLAAWLEGLARARPEALVGRVELYPAANPLGVDALLREVPPFGTDMNRSFPGRAGGSLPGRLADSLMRSLEGCALVLDLHGSNRFLREIPQLRILPDYAETLIPLARHLNVDLAWLQPSALRSTLRSQLNERGVPCIAIETGIAQRVHAEQVRQLLSGVLNVCRALGVLSEDLELPPCDRRPRVVADAAIRYVNAPASGLFIPCVGHDSMVVEGQTLGHIVSPEKARPLAEVLAPAAGKLFTLRELPLTHEGSLLARIVLADAWEGGA
jgi:predicted deacylase